MVDNNPDGDIAIDTVILDDKLGKIRSQINSKLENQKRLAIILSAIEENINEQNNEKTPVAYFVSFLSLLDESIKEDDIVDVSLATSAVYFLDIVAPFTPKPLLKARFGDILAKLATPLTHSGAEAPLVRSTIGALEGLLLAQDNQQWATSGSVSPKRAAVGLLELSFDPRPKVRKRAQEALRNILSNPPPSPSKVHVVATLLAELSLQRLVSYAESAKKEKKSSNKEANANLIHCLQTITVITSSNAWPSNLIENLCDVLLEISKTSDQFLISSAFEAFEGLFQSMTQSVDIERFINVVNVIVDLKPSLNDYHLAASWLAVVAKALERFAAFSPVASILKLKDLVPIVSQFMESDSKDIYVSASQCLIAIITEAIPNEFLLLPSQENNVSEEIYNNVDDFISFFAEFIERELFSIKYQHAIKEILELITATLLKLRSRSNPDFLGVLEIVGSWRSNESDQFSFNKEAEDVIASAISVMGPQVVLGVLPLNLTNSQGGRAWLLPILRDNVRSAELGFYKQSILPVVDFFEDKINQTTNKNTVHVKIFQTIVDQIWSLLPHFCDLPVDLRKAFDDDFASKLSELMYSKVELRVPICHALRLLVESNVAYGEGALAEDLMMQQEFPIEQAKRNIEYLSLKSSNILSVLFNIFSSTSMDSRGYIIETIDQYLKIVPKSDLTNTFNKVCEVLKTAMADDSTVKSNPKDSETPRLSVTMMDLIVAMTKYVPDASHNALFSIFSSTVVSHEDSLMQKRSYRIISRLCETEEGRTSIKNFIGDINSVIINTTETTHNAARTPRLTCISDLIDLVPSSDLYIIPSVLSEIVISTKDVNERTRNLSYQILTKMGRRMAAGGTVNNSKVPGFDPSMEDSSATLTEYFTMVSAGLAAQAPHMISATITALSCLVYEFKDELPQDVLLEIASTVELFLTHNAREIAKSAIGFVKVEVLSLPEETVRSNLSGLLSKLMRWSHEHKGHFKSKVKHILERLIRKFGIDEIEQAMPEEDRKLIVNIKKTRNRAKRKKLEEGERESQDKKFVSAYEEALYDSEDSDDDDDEVNEPSTSNKRSSQFIVENSDEPLNLLDRQAMSHISSSKPNARPQNISASKVKTKNGKYVFDEGDDLLTDKSSGIDAYLDAIKQAPIRGQRNKLKFKQSKQSDDWSEDEEKEPSAASSKKGKKIDKSRIAKPKQKSKLKARKKL